MEPIRSAGIQVSRDSPAVSSKRAICLAGKALRARSESKRNMTMSNSDLHPGPAELRLARGAALIVVLTLAFTGAVVQAAEASVNKSLLGRGGPAPS